MTSQPQDIPTPEEINALIDALGNEDGQVRQEARGKLVHYGKVVSPYLHEAMGDQNDHVRWEATKALAAIKDPAAIPVLIGALMDDRSEIRWLAGEALIALGERAIKPVLEGLVMHFGSNDFRHGAYHVLHAFERHNMLTEDEIEVLDALRSLASESNTAWAAERALEVSKRE